MNYIHIILLLLFAVFGSSTEQGQNETLVETAIFGGAEKSFRQFINTEFEKLDANKNGKLEIRDFMERLRRIESNAFNNSSLANVYGFDDETLEMQFNVMDRNNDSYVSKDEFYEVMSNEVLNQKLNLNPRFCEATLDHLHQVCAGSNSTSVPEMLNVVRLKCYSGVSSLFDFQNEKCISNATSCDGVSICFNQSYTPAEVKKISNQVALPQNHLPTEISKAKRGGQIFGMSLFYFTYLSALVAGLFLPVPIGFITGAFTSTIAGVTFILQLGSQSSNEMFNRMGITKWQSEHAAYQWIDNLIQRKPLFKQRESLPPPPTCDVWVYWSRSCNAIGSKASRRCSDGGSLVRKHSCTTHFSPASHTCGVQGFGCQSLCYNSNFTTCDNTFRYKNAECSGFNLESLSIANLPVRSFDECIQNCKHAYKDSCSTFVFTGADWGSAISNCFIYNSTSQPTLIQGLHGSGCVQGTKISS
ncbi:hypothetical protein MP638_003934 [Amoeboaphelidium occidentale]|nr:hypothetical protein MP638_003934 [Amoeboaphelidium occidentale]